MGEDAQKYQSIDALSILSHLGTMQNAFQEQTWEQEWQLYKNWKTQYGISLMKQYNLSLF